MTEQERFQEYLKRRGLKLTAQREVILKRVLKLRKHFSADELFDDLRRTDQGISKATVYRTLNLLVEASLLEEHDFFDRGHKVYERAARESHHDHLICVACQRIVEFHNEEIERLQDDVTQRYDFEMVSHIHQIFGVCASCRVERDEAKPRTRVGGSR